MNYEKQTWTTGEVITAEKLNHMEDGITGAGSSVLIHAVNHSDIGKFVLDKTFNEIQTLYQNGSLCIIVMPIVDIPGYEDQTFTGIVMCTESQPDNDSFLVSIYNYNFYADSVDDYPSWNYSD